MIHLIVDDVGLSFMHDLIHDAEILQIDTETTGFDPHSDKILTLQIGTEDGEHQYVLDASKVDMGHKDIKDLLEEKILIFQNAKFDLQFLFKIGIWPTKIRDTFIAECVLTTGLKIRSLGLDALAFKYCDEVLDKSIRANIHKEGLTDRVVRYAADDVKFLNAIYEAQQKKIQSEKLERVLSLEEQYVKVLAYAEFCGFGINTEAWKKNTDIFKDKLEIHKERVTEWIHENLSQYRDTQLDMFSTENKLNISIDSAKDMTGVFQDLGIDTQITFKGKTKDTIEAKHLKKFKKTTPLVEIYMEYSGVRKLVTTYGESFLDYVNDTTGRLHSSYWQILNTGRISSSDPNLQNIPADEEIRGCFIAEEDNTLIVADYSAQETRVLADMAKEQNYIEFFLNGDGDSHSMVASRMFTEIEGKPVVVSGTQNTDLRQIGKILSFQIAYGASAWSVKDSFNISEERAQKFIDAYLDSFPDLKKYFEKRKREVIAKGYLVTDPITLRRIYMGGFERFQEVAKERRAIYDAGERPSKELTREFYSMKGAFERAALNYPIQSVSASMMKLAGVRLFDWILKKGYQNKVKIVSFIHDETCLECPKDMAQEVADAVQDFMENSAKVFCKTVPIPAKPNITKFWKK